MSLLLDSNKTVVIKLGSQVVSKLITDRQSVFWQQLQLPYDKGYQPVIVCSGAVALGWQVFQSMASNKAKLPSKSIRFEKAQLQKHSFQKEQFQTEPKQTAKHQSYPVANKTMLASIGQGELINMWRNGLGRPVAQILVEQAHFNERHCYNDLSATFRQLLKHDVVPIINQNDALAEANSLISNNDRLAAYVVNMLEAKWLFMVSEVGGIYRDYPTCQQLVSVFEVKEPDSEYLYEDVISSDCSAMGTGGMREKLDAALLAAKQGAQCFICDEKAPFLHIIESRATCGTYIRYSSQPVKRIKHWLLNTAESKGLIIIDSGAAIALRHRNASLLMSGIVGVAGTFSKQAIVEVKEQGTGEIIAKGMARLNSNQILINLALRQNQASNSQFIPSNIVPDYPLHLASGRVVDKIEHNDIQEHTDNSFIKGSTIVLHRNQCALL